ncbi:MAG: hypothetical protein NT123_24955, partial [Proteobacteria bacterium]|nr:hypothetical protein [Pseudomonadota bacterium]
MNLLAATAGGHLTRARAFLERFSRYAGGAELTVLKVKGVLTDCKSSNAYRVIDVPIDLKKFRAVRRMAWENWVMPGLLRENKIDVYLTFHHYL